MREPLSIKMHPPDVSLEAWGEASEYLRFMLVKAFRRNFPDGGRLSSRLGRLKRSRDLWVHSDTGYVRVVNNPRTGTFT